MCACVSAAPTVPDARCEMRERYCRMVHRVSTSMLILLRYMRMRGMRPGNPSWEREKERGAMYIRCVSACSFVVYVHNVGVCTGIHINLQAPSR